MQHKILTEFFKKNAVSYCIGILFMFLASYIQTLFPKVLGTTIDLMKTGQFQPAAVNLNIRYIVAIALTTFTCTFIWRNLIIGNARNLECYLREKLFHHFERLAPEFYSTHKTGDLIAYAINDISAIRLTFGPATAMSFNGLVICASSIYFMFSAIDFRLTALTLAPLILVLVLLQVVGKKIQLQFRTVQENFGAISDKVQENISGIRVIKAFVQEEKEIQKFEALSDQMMESSLQLVKTSASLGPLIDICFSLSFVINLVVGGSMVLNNKITLGDFVAFNSYLAMIVAPVVSFGRVITLFHRGMASLARLKEIFQVKPAIATNQAGLTAPLRGQIAFRNLSFSYPGATTAALTGINLTIPAGTTLGIIGKTGSGKSTLAQLLLKLLNAPAETIYLDDNDLCAYTLETLRAGIGFVPQDTFLFSATIRENIAAFKVGYSDAAIHNAAQLSGIYQTVQDFPQGFATLLGERGINLSGGQKQRIALARALIKDPAILILDDALSAIDTVTQTEILQNLKTFRQNKTTIIISHRVSAITEANHIIVLDRGRICEAGTHTELLEKGGFYYAIYTEQTTTDSTIDQAPSE